MLGKDYRSKNDTELVDLATKYNIRYSVGYIAGENVSTGLPVLADREGVIRELMVRDTAQTAQFATIISIVSLLVSIVALAVSAFRN